MKISYNSIIRAPLIFLLLCTVSICKSQGFINWDAAIGANNLTGTAGIVTANITTTADGIPLDFDSPPNVNLNLPTFGAQTFKTLGASDNGPSSSILLTFDRPIIITRYSMADIDRGTIPLGSWDDSFVFIGTNFTQSIAQNCITTTGGGFATGDFGVSAESASWMCSTPLIEFAINFAPRPNLDSAIIYHAIEVFPLPVAEEICQFTTNPAFPALADGIQGTWFPSVIETDIAGTTNYEFTPLGGQSLTCPFSIPITIVSCGGCAPNVTLEASADNMDNSGPDNVTHVETGDWIRARNLIFAGNNDFEDGVIYHAGSWIELEDGFEAHAGAQFSAYIAECSSGFEYRESKKETPVKLPSQYSSSKPNFLKLYTEHSSNAVTITLPNYNVNTIDIYNVMGHVLLHKSDLDGDQFTVDTSNLPEGIYIVKAVTTDGTVFTNKFIKKT